MLLICDKYLLKESVGSFRSELINYICAHSMNMEPSLDLDKQIFREMVKFYGETLHIPPLAAKIYSYLIFDFEKKGICFDEFVQESGIELPEVLKQAERQSPVYRSSLNGSPFLAKGYISSVEFIESLRVLVDSTSTTCVNLLTL